ncbi:hypothetical protein [Lacticaseibacillus chiayiensis]|uniref:hypothetical protein n=1 Tax=Lacticaseibacillus chiayiensis TaxID=2100821 RepID=UPI0010104C2F|nr:hypothetical protein [Lacticaseibacillus chiayiensis]RXT59453.1 hypothetical protein CHT97_00475 [Lacticaseibacillus chiayiensis]
MRRSDEMEQKFMDTAAKYMYFITVLALVIYDILTSIQNITIGLIVALQPVGFGIIYEWLKYKADDTDREPRQFVVWGVVITAGLILIGLLGLIL